MRLFMILHWATLEKLGRPFGERLFLVLRAAARALPGALALAARVDARGRAR